MRRRLLRVAFAAALVTLAPAVHATPESEARATKLFDEAKKERDAGHYERALTLFKQSADADPSFGAYFNQGICHEQLGKEQPARLYDAVDAYKKAHDFAAAKGDARVSDARDAIAKLHDTHDYVILQVTPEVESAAGLRVDVDGDFVPARRYNGEVWLKSAADHEIVIAAKGRRDRRLTAKNRTTVAVVLGEPALEPSPASPPPSPPETSGGGWGWQKWTGLGVGTTGLVVFGVGVVNALWYLGYGSDKEDLDQKRQGCVVRSGRVDCSRAPDPVAARAAAAAYDENEQKAKDRAVPTVVLGAVGAVMIGFGAYLFFSAPSNEEKTTTAKADGLKVRLVPQLSPRENGLSVVGTF
ncbi:MAG: tetratricopeptide repeat protein [Labilithrix sp.]|nr:tetratricopeptide repeat protein [Labilithrix sp.]